MACVASAAGGPIDIVRDGVTGVLVAPGDPAALADAIERLWRDEALRLRMGEAAAADVRARFAPEREVDACEALYLSLLAPRAG
jgi:glycosyltransferase involved in cell wall biosynthesis